MSRSKSAVGRLFGAVWSVFVFVYRAVFVLSLLLVVAVVLMLLSDARTIKVEDNVALVIAPEGRLVDWSDRHPADRFFEEMFSFGRTQTEVRDLVRAIDAATTDQRIDMVALKVDGLWGAGLAQIDELGAALHRFRESGKPVHVYGPHYTQQQYLLASYADDISVDPMGMVWLEGYSVYQNYFREGLDKLGVDVNAFRVGEYKSAIEPFIRDDMSSETRADHREWLNALWQGFGADVGTNREVSAGAVDDYVQALPDRMEQTGGDAARVALDAGLVDHVESLHDYRNRMGALVGMDENGHGSFRQIHYSDYLQALRRTTRTRRTAKRIALVHVQGEIVDGPSEPGFAGGDTVSELLEQARQAGDVAAVLLRVDSPGGSVWASERIRREVRNLRASGKPVVASMSSMAASGGYWVAMDADEIWAYDNTITGSIGIFGLWLTLDRTLEKLGIRTDGIGTTPLAGAFRSDRPMPEDARRLVQADIERGYRLFIEGVAQGRGMSVDQVDKIARGRVWTGAEAQRLGLVDQLGRQEQAVQAAARLAGLAEGQYRLDRLTPDYGFTGMLLQRMTGRLNAGWLRGVQGMWPQGALVAEAVRPLRWLNDPRGQYAHCLCVPRVAGNPRMSME